jgi:hypothetical protein
VPGAAAIITDLATVGVDSTVPAATLTAMTGTPHAVMVAHSPCDIGCEQGVWWCVSAGAGMCWCDAMVGIASMGPMS